MSFELKQMQKLILWNFAISEQHGEFIGNLKNLNPQDRNELLGLKLIEMQKKIGNKGRLCGYIELTDKGFNWCNQNMNIELSGNASQPIMANIINSMLTRLSRLFEQSSEVNAIGTFVNKTKALMQDETPVEQVPTIAEPLQVDTPTEIDQPINLEQEITETCLKLNDGVTSKRIRIAEVKQYLNEFTHEQIDKTLLKLNDEGRLVLYGMDDPRDIQAEDKQAALHLPSGAERHIIYLESK